MTRIRSVKPELFTHEGLFEAEIYYKLPLRLAFIGLFTCCDRKGRFRWQPRRLKLDVFPYDNIDFAHVLNVLHSCQFIVKYENNGEIYGWIPSWLQHQHINNKEMASTLPAFEESTILPVGNHVSFSGTLHVPDTSSTRESFVDDASETIFTGTCHSEKSLEDNQSLVKKRETKNAEATQQIFAHWKTVMGHPTAKLDQKRKAIIVRALQFGYGVDELCEAITGCSYTPHNIGDNDRGQRYDGLHVILRDGDQIDRFIHNCKFPPKPITDGERRTMANVATLQSWVSKKMAEEK